jgi:hypothetical protein
LLDVRRPDDVLATARTEIETEIAAMLRGDFSHTVTSLCVGAICIREMAPTAREWIATTAPLRAPCCTRQYLRASDFVTKHFVAIRRVARSLAGSGYLSAAQALWVGDESPAKSAA